MTSFINRIFCLLLLFAATSLIRAVETSAISSSSSSPAVNQTFTVTVEMTATTGYSCWGQVLTWNASKVRLDSQDAGHELTGLVSRQQRQVGDVGVLGDLFEGGR